MAQATSGTAGSTPPLSKVKEPRIRLMLPRITWKLFEYGVIVSEDLTGDESVTPPGTTDGLTYTKRKFLDYSLRKDDAGTIIPGIFAFMLEALAEDLEYAIPGHECLERLRDTAVVVEIGGITKLANVHKNYWVSMHRSLNRILQADIKNSERFIDDIRRLKIDASAPTRELKSKLAQEGLGGAYRVASRDLKILKTRFEGNAQRSLKLSEKLAQLLEECNGLAKRMRDDAANVNLE